jgi:REP element-mobilizing transposase RayT
MPDDFYSFDIESTAYQLRWSLAIFPKSTLPEPNRWTETLSKACEADGVRVHDAYRSANNSLMLLLSSQPQVKPATIVQRVKGRLQHLLRPQGQVSWQRNFRLTALGDANTESVDRYVEDQLGHHRMASDRTQQVLQELAWHDPTVDLDRPINSGHGQYVLGMHAVLVHAEHWRNANRDFLELTQKSIRATLAHANCQAARIAMLTDHVHVLFSSSYDVAPADVIIAMMNDSSESHRGLRRWSDGFYVGTCGAYNMAAVRRNLVRG